MGPREDCDESAERLAFHGQELVQFEFGYAVILGIIFHAAHFAGSQTWCKVVWYGHCEGFPRKKRARSLGWYKGRNGNDQHDWSRYIDCLARQSVSVSYIFRSGNCKREAAACLSVQVLSHWMTWGKAFFPAKHKLHSIERYRDLHPKAWDRQQTYSIIYHHISSSKDVPPKVKKIHQTIGVSHHDLPSCVFEWPLRAFLLKTRQAVGTDLQSGFGEGGWH